MKVINNLQFSYFFQYTFQENVWYFYIANKLFKLDFSKEEKKSFNKFYQIYIRKLFNRANFLYKMWSSKRNNIILAFLIKAKIIINKNDWYSSEIIHWSNLCNGNLTTSAVDEDTAFNLCKTQHKTSKTNIIKNQNWIIFNLLKNRKTNRQYKNYNYNTKEIKYLFQCMYWNINQKKFKNFDFIHKTTPSWWAFYPLQINFFKFNYWNTIDLLKFDGIKLKKICKIKDKNNFIKNNIIYNPLLDTINATGLILITSNIEYISQKYWAKSYQLVLLEWWHACQNFVLACEELNYWNCELWWVYENQLLKDSWIDNNKNIFINAILFGKNQ